MFKMKRIIYFSDLFLYLELNKNVLWWEKVFSRSRKATRQLVGMKIFGRRLTWGKQNTNFEERIEDPILSNDKDRFWMFRWSRFECRKFISIPKLKLWIAASGILRGVNASALVWIDARHHYISQCFGAKRLWLLNVSFRHIIVFVNLLWNHSIKGLQENLLSL